MERIDFQAIKRVVTMDKAIKFLGLDGKFEQPTQFRCACPACKPDGRRELSISTEKNAFQCYAAPIKTGGDVIYLVAHVKGIKQGEAGRLLFEQFMREPDKPKRKPVNRRKTKINQNAPVGGTDEMDQWEAFIGRL